MLFQLHHVFWGPWKGLIKERRQRGKLQLGDRGGMMKQGKHSLGHLLIEGNTVCSKAMLILLLCHPQVHPLCSNAPGWVSHIRTDRDRGAVSTNSNGHPEDGRCALLTYRVDAPV